MATQAVTTSVFSRKQILVALYAALVLFLTYASIFAYRKPFTVATFEGLSFWGISYQSLLIISQSLGYMLSKFWGIKFISELKQLGRWKTTIILIAVAWLCLLIFAVVPAEFGLLCLFVYGFVLGFMWGIIFSYAEGRRATDFIGSVLAVSFIFAGGFSRSIGKWLMLSWNVSEKWMPFMTGLVFLFPLILFLYLLERIPKPDKDDIDERTERSPMTKEDRKKFLRHFGFGIAAVTVTYLFLTVMRDVRDNFMSNIWNELGYGDNASIFARTETNTSLIILFMISSMVLIRKNMKAFRIIHVAILCGFLLAGISSAFFVTGALDGALWMQLVGLGLYMAYIPFNCIFFERMIASFRIGGNVGFLIYIADAFGYLGSISVMLAKEILKVKANWPEFYSQGVVMFSIVGCFGTIISFVYFNRKYRLQKVSIKEGFR
jgi:MFS family permease